MVLDEPPESVQTVELLRPVVVLGQVRNYLLQHLLRVVDRSQFLL